ncbi:MAG TPA: peptide ABC transporter substrate-binding protein [Candidatus Baltobacteraceae bacterium]|nr:peptide ABC transporter substrate-binding protein [Candidatus Baltobacteraceae bacterium]
MPRLVAAFALALLAACTKAGGTAGWGTPHQMTIVRSNDPPSLNPLFEFDQPDIDLAQLYVEPLVGLSSQNTPIPIVASRVPTVRNGDVAPDGRTVTYHLRHDERFADGTPLTSKDVAFTYRAILDPRNPVAEAQPYRIVERLDTPDPYTVVLHLRRPWAAAVAALFAESDFIYGILPAHAFASTDVSHAAWNEHPFGSGPFRVVRWKRGDEIVLAPNPYARRKPRLRHLVIKIVPDRNTELLLLRTHAADVDDYLTNFQVVEARSIPDIRLVKTAKNFVDYLAFQTRRFPTDDPAVRRALLEAIDVGSIARKVYYGLWPVASTEIAPVLWAHDAAIPAPVYDPARAAAELDADGWRLHHGRRTKDGRPLRIELAYGTWSQEAASLATIVQAELAKIGVTTILRAYPTTVYYGVPNGTYYGGRFNLAWGGFYGGSDPEQSEIFTCDRVAPQGPNAQRWCDPRYDRLFLQQSRLLNRAARRNAFDAMQRVVNDAILFVPLVYEGNISAINPAVRGWNPNMLFEFSNSEDWDVY